MWGEGDMRVVDPMGLVDKLPVDCRVEALNIN